MKIQFVKMHGCGNDFVLVDGQGFPPEAPWNQWAVRLLDRRFGVGADQLLVLLPSKSADARMRIFERDGAESEMCGNGIRCAARFLRERGNDASSISFETVGGVKTVSVESNERIRVDMGKPGFDPQWEKQVEVDGKKLLLHVLSMGNPHAVIFVDSIEELSQTTKLGPLIERHALFPKRTNVEFVFVSDESNLAVGIWERGAGETFACGTGASASGVASLKMGKVKSPVAVHFRGGTLEIAWEPGGPVFMTGPASRVFKGEVEV
ncbi:MAG: diaminopimelate epimerase [Pseudomonadota bacterium]